MQNGRVMRPGKRQLKGPPLLLYRTPDWEWYNITTNEAVTPFLVILWSLFVCMGIFASIFGQFPTVCGHFVSFFFFFFTFCIYLLYSCVSFWSFCCVLKELCVFQTRHIKTEILRLCPFGNPSLKTWTREWHRSSNLIFIKKVNKYIYQTVELLL